MCDYKNSKGNTALIEATINPCPNVVEILLEAGANPNILNNNGATALMFSVFLDYDIERGHDMYRQNKYDIIKLLMKYGAKVNIKDKTGTTALDIMQMRADLGDGEVKYLFYEKLKERQEEERLQIAKSRLALASGLHSRLGANTPLVPDVIDKISQNITGKGKGKKKKKKKKKKTKSKNK